MSSSTLSDDDSGPMTMSDYSTKSSPNRTLAITIERTKGGTWYSSDWNGASTVEKPIFTGNVSVR